MQRANPEQSVRARGQCLAKRVCKGCAPSKAYSQHVFVAKFAVQISKGAQEMLPLAGQGRAGQGRAGQGRAGQGRAGQGSAGQSVIG